MISKTQLTREARDSVTSAEELEEVQRQGTPCPHHLDVFVQVHRLIVNVVLQKVLVHTGQQGHLGQGEDVHELLHGVSVGTLRAGRKASARESTPQ